MPATSSGALLPALAPSLSLSATPATPTGAGSHTVGGWAMPTGSDDDRCRPVGPVAPRTGLGTLPSDTARPEDR